MYKKLPPKILVAFVLFLSCNNLSGQTVNAKNGAKESKSTTAKKINHKNNSSSISALPSSDSEKSNEVKSGDEKIMSKPDPQILDADGHPCLRAYVPPVSTVSPALIVDPK